MAAASRWKPNVCVAPVTGSMALLVSWGDQQTFALSVGGFHPDFRDFPAIPALPDGFFSQEPRQDLGSVLAELAEEGQHLAIQNDRQVLVDVPGGVVAKGLRRVGLEREGDHV